MRILAALTLTAATLFGSVAAHAATGRTAKGFIVSAIQKSSRIPDKSTPFKTKLGGKAGAQLRPFTANNVHYVTIPGKAPAGAQGGARLSVGSTVIGTINMKTNRVRINNVWQSK